MRSVVQSDIFKTALSNQFVEYAEISELPITGVIFEERVHKALVNCSVKSDWLPRKQSHKSGSDILGLSLKCNKIYHRGGRKCTSMTSYRTASFPLWPDKLNFINIQDNLLKGYLFNAREETDIDTQYNIFFMEKKLGHFLDLSKYKISENNGDFAGIHPLGIRFEIRKSTSGQLIFSNIPLDFMTGDEVMSIHIKHKVLNTKDLREPPAPPLSP